MCICVYLLHIPLLHINVGDDSTIKLSDSPLPSPELTPWIADLYLSVADEKILLSGLQITFPLLIG